MSLHLQAGQPRSLGARAVGVGRKKEIAHVSARQVDLAADLIQSAKPFEERLAGLRLVVADVIEFHQRSSGGADYARQKAAKSERERQPRRPATLNFAGGFFADRCCRH